jgi:hypothetical protein
MDKDPDDFMYFIGTVQHAGEEQDRSMGNTVLLSFCRSSLNMAYNFAIMLPPPVLNLFCSQVEIKAPSRSLFIEPCR